MRGAFSRAGEPLCASSFQTGISANFYNKSHEKLNIRLFLTLALLGTFETLGWSVVDADVLSMQARPWSTPTHIYLQPVRIINFSKLANIWAVFRGNACHDWSATLNESRVSAARAFLIPTVNSPALGRRRNHRTLGVSTPAHGD